MIWAAAQILLNTPPSPPGLPNSKAMDSQDRGHWNQCPALLFVSSCLLFTREESWHYGLALKLGMPWSPKHMETIPFPKAFMVSQLHGAWFCSCSYNFCSAPTLAQMVSIRMHCSEKANWVLIKGWLSEACLQMRKIKQLLWIGQYVASVVGIALSPHVESPVLQAGPVIASECFVAQQTPWGPTE